jgi:hypothetical protein
VTRHPARHGDDGADLSEQDRDPVAFFEEADESPFVGLLQVEAA